MAAASFIFPIGDGNNCNYLDVINISWTTSGLDVHGQVDVIFWLQDTINSSYYHNGQFRLPRRTDVRLIAHTQ